MESRARLLGHSVHQMLIVFPVGLLATAVLFDVAYLASGRELMAAVSYWVMAAGLIGGLVAAPFGLVDWLAIEPGTRARRIGKVHGLGNVVMLALFAVSWWLRGSADEPPAAAALALSFAGAALAMFTAWLGGELVARLGVGVYERANVNAPSSLGEHEGEPRQVHGH